MIYPQGTRVAPGDHKPYKVGSAVLYTELGQRCYPVACNVGVFWPRYGILKKPGTAVIEFLDPIEPGLEKNAFMSHLEDVVETRSKELMRYAGFNSIEYLQTVEGLEALYGDAAPASLRKVVDRITPKYWHWISSSRFCVLTTVGPAGTDGSPRGMMVHVSSRLMNTHWRCPIGAGIIVWIVGAILLRMGACRYCS